MGGGLKRGYPTVGPETLQPTRTKLARNTGWAKESQGAVRKAGCQIRCSPDHGCPKESLQVVSWEFLACSQDLRSHMQTSRTQLGKLISTPKTPKLKTEPQLRLYDTQQKPFANSQL